MSESEIVIFYLQLAALAISARLAGEFATRLRVPSVVGEIIAGVFLGPTLLRHFFPDLHSVLFPLTGSNHVGLAAITTLGVTLFLFAAGLEVDLRLMRKEAHRAWPISLAGIAVPFVAGFIPAILFPTLMGHYPTSNIVIFAIFVCTALSITALPVTAKILMDLNLYKTPFGMLIISSALADDFLGWTLVGVVFALDSVHDAGIFTAEKVALMVAVTIGFVALMMTVGRWAMNRLVGKLYELCANESGVIGFVLAFGLLGASITQAIGIHGLFGAFIVGVTVGSTNLKSETRKSIQGFVASFLAPVFFASVGLTVDFIANFSLPTVAIILLCACFGKIVGCFLAALSKGISSPVALSIGMAMNGRGSMEIILGLMAMQEHIITESLFVSLAIMAIVTSCLSGRYLEHKADILRTFDIPAGE